MAPIVTLSDTPIYGDFNQVIFTKVDRNRPYLWEIYPLDPPVIESGLLENPPLIDIDT
jgi:hypothetical protein